jgi:cation transport ATPase
VLPLARSAAKRRRSAIAYPLVARVAPLAETALPAPGVTRINRADHKEVQMLLLIVLAVLAVIAFGLGFTIKWLFIVAAVLAVLFLISLVTGGFGRGAGLRG